MTNQQRIEKLLADISDWPVDHASTAIFDGDNWHTFGDTERSYPLASVTKLLVAHSILVASEEEALTLDEELPGLAPDGATVRHLLAHTSGVGFDSREPEKAPGEKRIYSSAGYEILADAIEEKTGIAFGDYFREATVEPLGMRACSLEGSAGHGATGSVADLQKFIDEIFNPQTLHPETIDEALTVQLPGLNGIVPGYGSQKPADWGLGFQIHGHPKSRSGLWFGDDMPDDVAGHFGQSGTYLWLHQETQRAAIVLTDKAFGSWAKPLWHDYNNQLWGALGG